MEKGDGSTVSIKIILNLFEIYDIEKWYDIEKKDIEKYVSNRPM